METQRHSVDSHGQSAVWQTIEIVRAVYDNFPTVKEQWGRFGQQPLAHYVYSSHNIIGTFPIEKFVDIQGKKIGAAGVVGNFFSQTGATSVNGNWSLR